MLLGGNWVGRVEYLHYDFGDSGGQQQPPGFAPGIATTALASFTSGHLTVDVVRAGLSFKFGGGPI